MAKVTLEQAAELLLKADHILVLSHTFPDGDTLGSASALCHALKKLGKDFRFACDQEIPGKFQYLFKGIEEHIAPRPEIGDAEFIVSVDVAALELLGKCAGEFEGKIDLCLDHHGSNREFAQNSYVESIAAAMAQVMFKLIPLLGLEVDAKMAECIYTGMTTDTGCFRYRNVTPETLRMAADLMEMGVDCAGINMAMFETKSRSRFEIERRALETVEYGIGGKVAILTISLEMIASSGALEEDLDGISAIPRTIEGVLVGITMRERKENVYKVSLRTKDPRVKACDICAVFGGGGHAGAAGCTLEMPLEEAKKELIRVTDEYLRNL